MLENQRVHTRNFFSKRFIDCGYRNDDISSYPKPGKMKTTLTLCLICISFYTWSQQHKATKAEVEFNNRVMHALNGALPQHYKDWNLNLLSEMEDQMDEGTNIDDCKPGNCWETLNATAVYEAPYNNDEYVKLNKEIDGITGTDKASLAKKRALEFKSINNFRLTIKLFANFRNNESMTYCKQGGYQMLPPPAGWDLHYFGEMGPCPQPDTDAVQQDASFIVMGAPATTVNERRYETNYLGDPQFPLNPTLGGQHKVQNIVMYIQGSKELVQDFMNHVDSKMLRALMQK